MGQDIVELIPSITNFALQGKFQIGAITMLHHKHSVGAEGAWELMGHRNLPSLLNSPKLQDISI